MAISRGPKLVTNGLVLALDPSDDNSFAAQNLPIKNGLILWLDAADDDSFVYSSGTVVSQWRDKSGLNNHANQATVANQPNRNASTNSRKTIVFDGSNDFFNGTSNLSLSNGCSVFTVIKSSATGERDIITSTSMAANTDLYLYQQQSSGKFGNWAEIYTINAISTGTWYLLSVNIASGGSEALYLNGALQGSATRTLTDTRGYRIGANSSGGEFWNGEIAEIIIFNRGLSATEIKQVHNYLGQKWSILNTDRTIVDLSGNNNNGLLGNGTTANMPVYDYYNKGGLKFDGSNDYVSVGANASLQSNNVSIGIFFKTINNGQAVQFMGGYGDTGNYGYWIGTAGTDLRFKVGNGITALQITSGIVPNNDQIYYVVGTYDGASQKIYVDGVLKATGTTVTGNMSYTGMTDGFLLGQVQGFTASRYMTGNIYHTHVYNRALSAAEILQNYNAQKSRFTNTIVQQGLVLNLDAGNIYSYAGAGTVWYDVSGNSNNGTLTNGPTYNADVGGNIVFDGSNDYVAVTSAASIKNTSNLSLEGWVFISSAMNYYGGIIGKGISDSQEEYCLLVHSVNSKVYMDVGAGGGPYTDATFSFSLNTWYHIIGTHERIAGSSAIKIYVNGSLLSSSTVSPTSAVNDNTTNVSIGSRYDGGTSVWNGKIATARIYTRTLSAAEVLQNYNATKGRFGL